MNFLRGFFERRQPIQNEDGTIVDKHSGHKSKSDANDRNEPEDKDDNQE